MMRSCLAAGLMVLLACGGGGDHLDGMGMGGGGQYLGSATVGDFMEVAVDENAHTIQYRNVTNQLQATVPYTVAPDGGLTINDPNGHLIGGYERPGEGLVLEVDKGGPAQDTKCIAFAINRSQLNLEGLDGDYNFMRFRVENGGIEVGALHFNGSDKSMTGNSYVPKDNGYAPISMNVNSWEMCSSLVHLTGDGSKNLFATPSGMLTVDFPDGSLFCAKQQPSANFNSSAYPGTYKTMLYRKQVSSVNGGQEQGTVSILHVEVTVAGNQGVTVSDGQGYSFSDNLAPAANVLGGLGMPTNGLFAGQGKNYALFFDGALMIGHFVPGGGGTYEYAYGIGFKS